MSIFSSEGRFSVYGLLLLVLALTLPTTAGAQDIERYCKQSYGNQFRALALDRNDAFSWRCASGSQQLSVDVEGLCHTQFGANYHAQMLNRQDAFSWRCVTQSAQPAAPKTITQSVTLSPSPSAAGQNNPPCGDGSLDQKTLAQELLTAGGAALSAYLDNPAPLVIASNPQFSNWATARLGLHNGPSICKAICFIVPSTVTPSATGQIFSSNYPWGPGALRTDGFDENLPDNWAAIPGPTISVQGSTKALCWVAKNWSDNLERVIEIKLSY